MLVSELVEKLKTMPQDKHILLCNLEDDGNGDSLVVLREINGIEELKAQQGEKEVSIVCINYSH